MGRKQRGRLIRIGREEKRREFKIKVQCRKD
jgi:hypothetical protein